MDTALAFGRELIGLPYNDSDEAAELFGKFDAQLIHELNVKWLVNRGGLVSKHFDLNSKSVAWWLSNYVVGTGQALMRSIIIRPCLANNFAGTPWVRTY